MTTTTLPSLEELEAILRDQTKVNNLAAEGKLGQLIKDYGARRLEEQADVLDQVKAQTETVLADWLKDNGAASMGRLNLSPDQSVGSLAAQKNKLYNAKAPGALIDKDYQGSADFFQSIWHHANTLANSDEIFTRQAAWKKIQNSFGSTIPADGGFLIPETLRSELLSVALETAIVRPRARVIPMSSLRLPIPSVDATSNVSSRVRRGRRLLDRGGRGAHRVSGVVRPGRAGGQEAHRIQRSA